MKINNILTADGYIDILSDNLEESLLRVGLGSIFISQQGNDPKHANIIEWIIAQSPDLNPIENLWSIMDEKNDKRNVSNKDLFYGAEGSLRGSRCVFAPKTRGEHASTTPSSHKGKSGSL